MTRQWVIVLALAAFAMDPAESFRGKLRTIQSGKARRGSVFVFSSEEMNSYARSESRLEFPEGVRDPRVELGAGTAVGFAKIDFLRLRKDAETPWLLRKMIEGERPVKVSAHLQSGGGKATVFLDRVEISGVGVSGGALDVLIQTFFVPLFPDAKINREFSLSEGVDRIEVGRDAVRVTFRR